MVSNNNSQKRVNRKNKLTRRRVSNSSSKKRTNKRNNSTSPSPNKSKKRHSKKKSRKRTTSKTSKKRRKNKNSKNTKANNVLMKGGRKLYEALILSGKEMSELKLLNMAKELYFNNLPEGIIPYHSLKRLTTLEYLSQELLENQINIPFIDFMISLITIDDPKYLTNAQENIKQMTILKKAQKMELIATSDVRDQILGADKVIVQLKYKIIEALNQSNTEGLNGMIDIESISKIFSDNIGRVYPKDRIPEDFRGDIKEKIENLVETIINIIISMKDENLKKIMFFYIFGDMLKDTVPQKSKYARDLRNNMKHIICVLLNIIYNEKGDDILPLNISFIIDKPIVLLMYLLTQEAEEKNDIIEHLEKIIKILITESIQTNSEEIFNLIKELFHTQTLFEVSINSTIDKSTLGEFYKYKINFGNESRLRSE
jgi:hypothetical protein